MDEPRIERIRKLRVTKVFPINKYPIYKIENELLLFADSDYFYTNKDGLTYGNWTSSLPFPKSVLIATLESGEITEEEFDKIRKKRGYLVAATDEAVRKLVSESFKAGLKKELEEDAIKASGKLTSTGNF
jgi:hypothetical protein